MDIIKNKNLQLWFLFTLACKSAAAINGNLTQVYLTNDLAYPKEDLAMIKVCCMPVNLFVAVLAGHVTKNSAFTYELWALLSLVGICSYTVLFTLKTFPSKEKVSDWTHIHVIVVSAVYDLVLNFEFVTNFAIIMKIADRRISGMHITLLGVLSNMSEFVHKFYLF